MSGNSAARRSHVKSRWAWKLLQVTRRIWFRATLFSVLAVATALAALVLAPYIPSDLPTKIGSDAVDGILHIIASSMLAVTTFSLSTMVTAYGAATSNVTPRATQLVIEDTTTQNVLATFIGSFLFSLVGIIVLSTGLYGSQGRVVLFAVTILVIVGIVVTLLRWTDHLSRLGRVADTTDKVEEAAVEAMEARRQEPYLGGQALTDFSDVPHTAQPVFVDVIGYVQHLDMTELSRLVEDGCSKVFVNAVPGEFVDPSEPVAWVEKMAAEEWQHKVRSCFTIGDTRSFDQDPRFGASVLSEVASRALSPGINDPGTAIDVIGRAVRVLAVWTKPVEPSMDEVMHPNVFVPPVLLDDLFDDLFTPIARDGAKTVEVCIRLQKALLTLARIGDEQFGRNALRHANDALARAEAGLTLEIDKQRVRDVAVQVGAQRAAALPQTI